MKMKWRITGAAVLMLIALWGGAYSLNVCEPGKHWAAFPILATAGMMMVGGVALVVSDPKFPI
jgi:hypothetical protein